MKYPKIIPEIFVFGLLFQLGFTQLIITHAPSTVKFLQTFKKLPTSDVPSVISSSLGFQEKVNWDGLGEGSLFSRPKAAALFTVQAPNSFKPTGVKSYPIEHDDPEVNLENIMRNVDNMFISQQPLLVALNPGTNPFDLKSQYSKIFSKLAVTYSDLLAKLKTTESIGNSFTLGSLSLEKSADATFLAELQLISEIVKALKANPSLVKDSIPDLFHFEINSLKLLVEEYGENSVKVKDAVKALENFFAQVTEELKKLYNDNIVVAVLSLPKADPNLVRKSRSLKAATTAAPKPKRKLNLAEVYDSDYPALFNITLWTMVVLAIAVYCISVGIWHMDPGRDSIIYRMTSQRMKKD